MTFISTFTCAQAFRTLNFKQHWSVNHIFDHVASSFIGMVLQDIIDDDEIKLDWFFKASMMNDLVSVRDYNLFIPVKISHGFTINNKQCVILLDHID